jgi:hypothetical protein
MRPKQSNVRLSLTTYLFAVSALWCGCGPTGTSEPSSPFYQAKDNDPKLTPIARTAIPVTAALENYRHDKGSFPTNLGDLIPYLPAGVSLTQDPLVGSSIGHWAYFPGYLGTSGYLLSHSLGHDPTLNYIFDGTKGRWEFDPGTGDPVKVVSLTP